VSIKNILQILRELKNQKLRTSLTLFGIIWGTVSVILLLSFGFAIKARVSKNMHGLGESICIMWPGRTSISYAGFPKGRNINFNNGDAQYLKNQVPTIKYISPQYSRRTTVQVHNKKQSFQINAVWPEFKEMRNLIPRMGGRFLNKLDSKKRRRVAFIGFDVEEKMFGKDNGMGKTINIAGKPFTVVGVLIEKKQNSSYNGRDKDAIYIPVSTYLGMHNVKYINNMVYKARDVDQTEIMKEQVQTTLAQKYKFHPEDSEALGIWDTTENEKFLNTFFGGFNIFLGIVGVMTLIVGGIGISNIMYVVVEERTREIGIKRAIGAKKRTIRTQYLIETFLISGFGAIIGFLISMGIVWISNKFPIQESVGTIEINPIITIITITIIIAITLIAGWGPAKRASSLDPVVAIRE